MSRRETMNSAGGDRSARQCGLFFCLPEGNELYGLTTLDSSASVSRVCLVLALPRTPLPAKWTIRGHLAHTPPQGLQGVEKGETEYRSALRNHTHIGARSGTGWRGICNTGLAICCWVRVRPERLICVDATTRVTTAPHSALRQPGQQHLHAGAASPRTAYGARGPILTHVHPGNVGLNNLAVWWERMT
eukprot:352824-Chlamydomonas_euryale.AAC.8